MIHRERICAVMVGELQGERLPMIEVSRATDRDFSARSGGADTPEKPADCTDLSTFIWALSPEGQRSARRIAKELEQLGFALVYPHDEVVIARSRVHQIVEVAKRAYQERRGARS